MHIREFQDMMKRIYFHRDSKRGALATYDWLVGEVAELGAAMKGNNGRAIRSEFADVLAWLASLANVVNINLETAAFQKYTHKCPKCLQTPCVCPPR